MPEPRRTPLYDWHVAQGGRMVDFAGWEMPVQYKSIVVEHNAVRSSAGLFDVSHMGRLFVSGKDAQQAIAQVVTCPVDSMADGRVRYGLVLADDGGTIDDVLVTRLNDKRWLVVANASGREAVLAKLVSAATSGDVDVVDRTVELAMLAVQGPKAIEIVDTWYSAAEKPSALGYYRAAEMKTEAGLKTLVSRTGYTGEDGVELIFDAGQAVDVADELLAAGVEPAGLGARDTLRLEAGMPLYGHELSMEIDPRSAGLQFAIRKSGGFCGAEALASKVVQRSRVGLRFEGKRPVRERTPLFSNDEEIGVVTSGTSSPTLGQPIAMAFVDLAFVEVGSELEAEVRGARIRGSVVALPFYKRAT